MASSNFTNLPRALTKGDVDFDAWVYRSDVTNEITGTGYTAGGIGL